MEEKWDLSLLSNPLARIARADVCGPLTVRVEFNDGVSGTVRFAESKLHGLFERLNDPAFFAQVGVDHGALAWPDDLDFCPHAIYMRVVKGGEWVLR